ncbi:unnamed protein product [Mesocestoides corti]|uniref:OBG-type G domain-containing protein n=1 Tax=Mesocestoides corti TaxID=53468 RepID=A0A158QW16_MESCO|nr:unnamed protein product [Mesocestoides corti]
MCNSDIQHPESKPLGCDTPSNRFCLVRSPGIKVSALAFSPAAASATLPPSSCGIDQGELLARSLRSGRRYQGVFGETGSLGDRGSSTPLVIVTADVCPIRFAHTCAPARARTKRASSLPRQHFSPMTSAGLRGSQTVVIPDTAQIADLPGLIEGAAERNAGLGSQFLSLIEGCAMLLYLVDVGTFLADRGQASASEATDHFASQLDMLHNELALFNPDLVDPSRGCLVIGTKLDLVVPPSGAQATLDKLSAWLADAAKLAGLPSARSLLVSARRGDNIDQLVEILKDLKPCRKAGFSTDGQVNYETVFAARSGYPKHAPLHSTPSPQPLRFPDGGESAYDDGEMVEIPYRIVKKWTDFKKRAHPRRVLLPRFE